MREVAISEFEKAGLWSYRLARIAPGVCLTAMIAVASMGLHRMPGLGGASTLIIAILIGMAIRNFIGTPLRAKAGTDFSLRYVLRAAIVLLGFQLTLSQIADLGWIGVVATMLTVGASFMFTLWFGRRLGIDRKLVALIAAGTSICGASAIVAANPVLKGGDEDVAYAIAIVTVFGSLSMVCFPLVNEALKLTPNAYGFWAGASIHEIAQVVAASFQGGDAAGQFGTIVKLTRVLMLAPVVLLLAWFWDRSGRADGNIRRVTVPWFAFGFLAVVALNSALPELPAFHGGVTAVTAFMMAMALAAMGLETDFGRLRAKGFRPLVLGAAAWVFIAAFGLVMASAAV